MKLPAIPEAKTVTTEHAAAFAAQVVTWAQTVRDIDALKDTKERVAAVESYLRRRHEAAAAEFAKADRKLEWRIGQLLPPKRQGARSDLTCPSEDKFPRQRANQFRKIAEHADAGEPEVLAAIERGASRADVLRATKQAEADAFVAEARSEARAINARFASRVGDRNENRDASRQRGELARLCDDLAALPGAKAFLRRHHKHLTDQDRQRVTSAHAWLDALLSEWSE